MQQDYTDITVVLDRSGSMSSVIDDTIGGFNTFLKDQQALPGRAAITLTQFDDQYDIVHDGKPIGDVPELNHQTYVPRGWTALLDAIGRTINRAGARLAAMPEADRPGKVVFVIVTDGQENASKEFTRDQVFKMISHQRDEYKWEFVFLGANQDAIAEATKLGVAASNSMTYASNAVGTKAAMRSTSSNVSNFRTGKTATAGYTQQDRDEQAKAGAQS